MDPPARARPDRDASTEDLSERPQRTPSLSLSELTWRRLDRRDLPAVVELGRKCLESDGGLGFLFDQDAVGERFFPEATGDRLGAFALDGRLVAAAAVHFREDSGVGRAVMVGHVRPDFRNRGIGTDLIRWSGDTAAVLLADVPIKRRVFQVDTESMTDAADRLYHANGYQQAEASLVMRRDLRHPIPRHSLPDGAILVPWTQRSAEQFSRAYGPAFVDRPGFPGWSAREWINRATANDLVPEWSLLARADDRALGFVIGCLDHSTSPPSGFIWQIGVVAGERKRGIGSALLVASMRRMQAADSPTAQLTVHTDNPNAIRVYERLGFEIAGRRARYERRDMPETSD